MIQMQVVQVPRYVVNFSPTKKELRDIALEIRTFIVKRTQSGTDINGRKFRRYSDAYRERKALQMTHRGSADTVNLMLTGEMHRSLSVKSTEKASEIYYANANRGEIAFRHQMGIGVPQREHFGVNDRDAQEFMDKLAKIVFARNNREWERPL